jgi:hypothetical protein
MAEEREKEEGRLGRRWAKVSSDLTLSWSSPYVALAVNRRLGLMLARRPTFQPYRTIDTTTRYYASIHLDVLDSDPLFHFE